jgi:hypothetical protein
VKVKRGEEISGLNTPPLKMIRGEEVFPPEIGLTIPPSLLARTDQVIDATAVSAPLGPRAPLGPLDHVNHLGHKAWPQVKPVLRCALEMRRQIRACGGGTRPLGRRLHAAHSALFMKETELEMALVHDCDA